jgi:hypothetical protein
MRGRWERISGMNTDGLNFYPRLAPKNGANLGHALMMMLRFRVEEGV